MVREGRRRNPSGNAQAKELLERKVFISESTLERDANLVLETSAEGAQALRLKDRGATRYLKYTDRGVLDMASSFFLFNEPVTE